MELPSSYNLDVQISRNYLLPGQLCIPIVLCNGKSIPSGTKHQRREVPKPGCRRTDVDITRLQFVDVDIETGR
jgi:hypothetical protein